VRIAAPIGVRVMDAMRRHPIDRIALKGERAANCGCIFERTHHAQRAVRERPVIVERDAESTGYLRNHDRDGDRRPREEVRKERK
jgi:hypothetical protein